MSHNANIGKKVIDITPLLGVFEAQEGQVEQIIGKTGMGKTYEATRRALRYLQNGYHVYTTWRLNLPDYFDERESPFHVLKSIFFFKKHLYRFDYRKNWHYVDLTTFEEEGVVDTEKLATFLATRTDCIFFLDEGQDVFDSHKRSGAIARQSITRTRHMHKTLIVVSQRASAVEISCRANVTFFYKCEKIKYPFLPMYFKVYYTEEIDESSNNPIWERKNSVGDTIWKAPVFYSGFAKTEIYEAYDSWYMRKHMAKSQDIDLEAFEVSNVDKWKMLKNLIFPKKNIEYKPSKFPILKTVDKLKSVKVKHLRKRAIIIPINKTT